MDFKIIFKDTFLEDLERIVRLVAAQNPLAARKLGEAAIRRSESLNFFPERFPRVRQRPGIRRFIVQKHFKVFYRIHHDSKTVEILRFWDGRRGIDPRVREA